MRRTLFEPEHEALRASVREFLDRHVRPRHEQFIADRQIPREIWIEAGKQGFLGLLIPEQYGGGGVADDWRFSAVLAEELAAVSIAFSSWHREQWRPVSRLDQSESALRFAHVRPTTNR